MERVGRLVRVPAPDSRKEILVDVIGTVAERRELVVERMTQSIRAAIPVYDERSDETLDAELLEHVRDNVDTFLECVQAGRTASQEDLAFIRKNMEHRVDQGVPLEDILQAFRIGLQAFWGSIIEESKHHASGSEAALTLALPAMQYIDVASSEVTESYVRIEERLRATTNRAQVQILRSLLEGRVPDERALVDVANSFTVNRAMNYLVVVSLEIPVSLVDDVRKSLERIGLAAPYRGSLVEVEGGQLTAVLALGEASPEDTSDALATELHEAAASSELESMRLGIGVPSPGVGELPQAHREAAAAARLAHPGETVAMPGMGVAERTAVMLRATGSGQRMVAGEVAAFIEADERSGGTLLKTVMVYCDCDLNARRTAEKLFVHANTVLYRLERVAEKSGLDPRGANQLLDLVTAIRLSRDA